MGIETSATTDRIRNDVYGPRNPGAHKGRPLWVPGISAKQCVHEH